MRLTACPMPGRSQRNSVRSPFGDRTMGDGGRAIVAVEQRPEAGQSSAWRRRAAPARSRRRRRPVTKRRAMWRKLASASARASSAVARQRVGERVDPLAEAPAAGSPAPAVVAARAPHRTAASAPRWLAASLSATFQPDADDGGALVREVGGRRRTRAASRPRRSSTVPLAAASGATCSCVPSTQTSASSRRARSCRKARSLWLTCASSVLASAAEVDRRPAGRGRRRSFGRTSASEASLEAARPARHAQVLQPVLGQHAERRRAASGKSAAIARDPALEQRVVAQLDLERLAELERVAGRNAGSPAWSAPPQLPNVSSARAIPSTLSASSIAEQGRFERRIALARRSRSIGRAGPDRGGGRCWRRAAISAPSAAAGAREPGAERRQRCAARAASARLGRRRLQRGARRPLRTR